MSEFLSVSPSARRLPFAVLCLILPALSVFLSSCAKTPSTEGGRKVLHLGNGVEPKDLDPAVVTGLPEFHIISALLEGLVTLDVPDLNPVPAAAETWMISDDQKTYTFHIRKNAIWSNGDDVTADDFVYSWRRLLDPLTASEYAYQAYYIKNGKPFNEGSLKDPTKLGVNATDSKTLVVTLESPTPFFLGLLNHHSLYPVHRRTVETHGARWTRPEHHVGNGPFRLKKWVTNLPLVVERNPAYWDSGVVRLDEIHFHPIEDMSTEEKQFRAGKLHRTNSLPLERISYWRNQKDVYYQVPELSTFYLELNVTRGPQKDKRVRKALSLSIDRTAIVEKVTRGGQIPAYAFTPPGTAGFTPVAHLYYDTEEARRLMAAAGYPEGRGFPKVDILYNTADANRQIAEALQQMWKKALGIEVGLFNQEWKVFLNTKKQKEYDISRMRWIGDYPDPNTFLDMYVTGGGNNNTGWTSKEFDGLIAKASRTASRQERYKYFQRCEDILAEEIPIIPIYTATHVHLMRPDVKGLHSNVMEIRRYKLVSLEAPK